MRRAAGRRAGEATVSSIRLDYTNMMSDAVGARHGATQRQWRDVARKAAEVGAQITGRNAPGFRRLLKDEATPARARAFARSCRRRFRDVVVLGIGGSALGTRALAGALLHPLHNAEASVRRGKPRLHVLDNVDPALIGPVFASLDPKTTLFNVITKSGSTAETMSQFAFAWSFARRALGEKRARDHFVVTTDAERGDLRRLARDKGITSFDIPADVGGRFSVLSAVGLVPAALVGIDTARLLAGARAMERRTRHGGVERNIAHTLAALLYVAHIAKAKAVQVLMPYASGLRMFAQWWRQLWAESLGKRRDLDGRAACAGPTPMGALGATDQHSLLQLFHEGPSDKTFTFIRVRERPKMRAFATPGIRCDSVNYLAGASFAELIDAEQRATEFALTRARRPNMTITIGRVDASALGGLFFLFEAAVAMSALLYNVDAFDQPGVEASKRATYALMGRKGFEAEAKRIAAAARKKRRTL